MILDIPISKRSASIEAILVKELRTYFRLNLNGNMRRKWEEYLLSTYGWNRSLLALYELILRNIKFSIVNGQYSMTIDPIAQYNGYSINTIARTLDNGILGIKGDHIISGAFAYLRDNIDYILKKYMRGY